MLSTEAFVLFDDGGGYLLLAVSASLKTQKRKTKVIAEEAKQWKKNWVGPTRFCGFCITSCESVRDRDGQIDR